MRLLRPLIVVVLILSLVFNVVLWMRYRNKKTIFTLNSEAVTRADMDDYLEKQFGPTYKAMMAQRLLLDQEARKKGIAPSETEINDEFALKKELDWQFASRIATSPWLADESREEIKQQLEQQKLLAQDISVTEEEVREEYNAHPALYDTPAKAHTEVAAVLNEIHLEDIRRLMEQADKPVGPRTIMQMYPREVVFIGDDDKFTFVQAYNTEMNKDVFTMGPHEVKVMLPGDLGQQGARRLVVKMLDIAPGKKADLNDPKTLNRIKMNVALRRTRPASEMLANLWANAQFQSADPGDKAQIERMFFPEQARTSK
ncbi:MAG: hypothetical protein JWL77_661 [Chthonomonadaceae bacterium]|nr:hypothetical protein [Chthonomonadaceae bacterium]